MIRLTCFRCGLTVAYEESAADLCPRCLARDGQAVQLIPVSDRPSSSSAHSMGRLTIEQSLAQRRCAMTLRGELDIASAPILEATLTEACEAGASEIVLEMEGVEFIDSTGLNAILRAQALCESCGCAFELTPARRPVQRVFEVTRLVSRLPFRRPERESASSGEPA